MATGRILFEQNAEKYNVDDAAAAGDDDYEVTDQQTAGLSLVEGCFLVYSSVL